LRGPRPKPKPRVPSKGKENRPPLGSVVAIDSGLQHDKGVTGEGNGVSSSIVVKVVESAPDWCKEAVDFLLSGGLGDEWVKCVGDWADLEKELNYGMSCTKVSFLSPFYVESFSNMVFSATSS
jgi:hypothetical protein